MSTAISALIGLALALAPSSDAKLPSNLDLSEVSAVTVQHSGRWMPLDTLARDLVWKVTGDQEYEGVDPVLMLLAWSFQPDAWVDQPLISIANAELRAELDLPSLPTRFSYSELVSSKGFHAQVDAMRSMGGGRKLNPLESKVRTIEGQLIAFQKITLGLSILPVPDPADANARWRSVSWALQSGEPVVQPVGQSWLAMRDAYLANDGPGFDTAVANFTTALEGLPFVYRPDADAISMEILFNQIRPFTMAWIAMFGGVILGVASLFTKRKAASTLATLALVVGFGLLSWGLWMRGTLAGRLPAANMYESLLFLSWGTGACAILASIFFRHRSVPLTASFMGALSLCLADSLPMDSFIRPIPPVLQDTVWMSIHVPTIMVSYSVLALAVLVAHVQVISMALMPERRRLAEQIDTAHMMYMHVGAILLFIGIVTGSMWAASSWGRYWGWDSKEVWSLIAFLGYMTIMHVRVRTDRVPGWALGVGALSCVAMVLFIAQTLAPLTPVKVAVYCALPIAMGFFVLARGVFATSVKSILAFWMIITTYVVVNYVLGTGLHSYGFGTGAIAYWVQLCAAADFGLIVLCGMIYLVRSKAIEPGPMTHEAPA